MKEIQNNFDKFHFLKNSPIKKNFKLGRDANEDDEELPP